jgi:hypothetical protein
LNGTAPLACIFARCAHTRRVRSGAKCKRASARARSVHVAGTGCVERGDARLAASRRVQHEAAREGRRLERRCQRPRSSTPPMTLRRHERRRAAASPAIPNDSRFGTCFARHRRKMTVPARSRRRRRKVSFFLASQVTGFSRQRHDDKLVAAPVVASVLSWWEI